jgi:peptide deformylase
MCNVIEMITTDEKILRMSCSDATPEEVGAIIEQLERELEYSARLGRQGVGLACPQINIHKNIAVVRLDANHSVNLVNCKIKNAYDEFIFEQEGCLSFPDMLVSTKRYNEIHIVDNLVYPHAFVLTGLMSIICQHELNHLQNILLPDIAIPEQKPQKTKIRPNDKCICGSNKKFKKCCGK